MTQSAFWAIINEARARAGLNHDRMRDITIQQLSDYEASEIMSFRALMSDYLGKANTWDLWAAAYILAGGCGDDSFQDFRRWLISMGQSVYEKALQNPESLAEVDIGPDGVFFEDFGSVDVKAYKNRTGRELAFDLPRTTTFKPVMKTSGEPWHSDAELAARLPRLFLRFGEAR